MRFEFIKTHAGVWPVAVMCRVLAVTPSGFYAWRKRPMCVRKENQMQLIEQIKTIHQDSRGTYGSPRVAAELRNQGRPVNEKTVAKLMKQAEIRVIRRPAFVPRTTVGDPSHQTFANVLGRDFAAAAPNRKWVVDITYIRTDEGWLFLATVMDLFSRKIVGWAVADNLLTTLVADALADAITRRKPGKGLLHHSDRGSQYTSENYQQLLKDNGVKVSMSDVGQCWDNAVAESFFSTIKRELINDRCFSTRIAASACLFEWIECWYNRKRLHSSLGYKSPEAFEAQNN